jgi:16S rRNA (adenine1518-N6/adenine1519-N6)-dimethyltransferase
MKKIAPQKSLGQNFLTNKTIAARIVDLLGDISSETVLEIGPGMGVLTEFLVERSKNFAAVEIDKRAVEFLRDKFANKLKIINTDILKFDFADFAQSYSDRIQVIGNIPYNISTEIFFRLFENANYIEKAVLTVQKEVAQRVASSEGTKTYGITSVAARLVAVPRIAFDISAGSFFPAPKVTSSVLVLDFYENQKYKTKYNEIMELVRACFSTRRKMLKNAIQNYLNLKKIDIQKLEYDLKEQNLNYLSKRAEQLSLDDFLKLYEIISKSKVVEFS